MYNADCHRSEMCHHFEEGHRSGYADKNGLSTGTQTFRFRITPYRATYLMKVTK